MDDARLSHFRSLLLKERARTKGLHEDQSAERVDTVRGVDGGDLSHSDVDKDLAFNLGEREVHLLGEIDDALQRIEDGTYGTCPKCGKPIDERRLEAAPAARYHAQCQAEIESAQGAEMPTL